MPEVTYSLDPAGLRVIDVLLVEDDPGDVLMTTEAFELSPMHSTLHVVSDGEQALRFLRRTGEFTGAPRPGLILLDLGHGPEQFAQIPGRQGGFVSLRDRVWRSSGRHVRKPVGLLPLPQARPVALIHGLVFGRACHHR